MMVENRCSSRRKIAVLFLSLALGLSGCAGSPAEDDLGDDTTTTEEPTTPDAEPSRAN